MKRLLVPMSQILAVATILILLALSACAGKPTPTPVPPPPNTDTITAAIKTVIAGNSSLKGPKGDTGENGTAAPTPSNAILQAAIQTVIAGNPSLKGPKGDTGDVGPRGTPGPVGPTGPTGPAGIARSQVMVVSPNPAKAGDLLTVVGYGFSSYQGQIATLTMTVQTGNAPAATVPAGVSTPVPGAVTVGGVGAIIGYDGVVQMTLSLPNGVLPTGNRPYSMLAYIQGQVVAQAFVYTQ